MKAAAVALAAVIGVAQAQTGPHFVHGSWVNVREAGANTARATEQLTTNTPVDVTARQGDWCAVRFGAGKAGFVACNLLGAKPLTLAEAGSNAARAFWVAPSPKRLAAYGLSLPPPPALRLEVLKKTLKYGDTVRFPPVAEFEAAKTLMKAGVTLDPRREIAGREPADPATALKGYGLRVAPIKPSLFRAHDSVALVSEADADRLAAVAAIKVSLTPTALPTAWHGRHDGPEIEGLTGFWDVGQATLAFDPPLVLYSVAANGLVGASAVRKLPFNIGGEGHYCGARYLKTSLPDADRVVANDDMEGLDAKSLRGYPRLTEGSEWLVSLAVPNGRPLLPTAKVRTQSAPVKRLATYGEGEVDAATFKRLKPAMALREIDLDGDGVADVLQIEAPRVYGEIAQAVMVRRDWYVNINGHWFDAGAWEDQDCT